MTTQDKDVQRTITLDITRCNHLSTVNIHSAINNRFMKMKFLQGIYSPNENTYHAC